MGPSSRQSPLDLRRAERYMRLAVREARKARERTWPNPMVGAVLVRGGQVIGRGYHKRAGLPHAEVEAIRDAGGSARGADLYVTLEPCHHFGRTGPCSEAIAQAGIRRVFVGAEDPNPSGCGCSAGLLRERGIEVTCGILAAECRVLNEVYNVFMPKRRPFVLVKVACSLDGRIAAASGDSRWISSRVSRKHAHELRARASAVLVGVGTLLADDPRLDVRLCEGRNPAAVVLDRSLRTPAVAQLFKVRRGAPVWIVHGPGVPRRRQEILMARGAKLIEVRASGGRLDLKAVLRELYIRGIFRLLVEGGSTVIGALMKAHLVDRLDVHVAPILLGADAIPLAGFTGLRKVAAAPYLEEVRWRRFGPDICCSGRVRFAGKRSQ